MERKRTLRGGLLLPLLGALAVWLASVTAAATTPDQAATALRDAGSAARVALWGSLGIPAEDVLPLPLALSVGQSPLLMAARAAPEADSPPVASGMSCAIKSFLVFIFSIWFRSTSRPFFLASTPLWSR